ncbi:FecR family protein [Sphingomonas echinoides]|uniref:DUF4880 domain-containing protein n=1 Tax=Sphingomonas echinoides TaxID=59803 RepID=A0ABU4PPY7_9SPHN|nr:DUF4880 domain-containing protein [Sphingomonas echinoides]MDX5985212.1 DUF4880 domain-containing protein [Sphingomonas echinoides]
MSGLSESPQQHADLTDEAAAWLAALDAGSADVAAFEAWREADIRHAVAFVEVASTWRDLDALRLANGELAREGRAEPIVPERPGRRHILRAAASVAVAVVVGGGFAYRAAARASATTAVGQRKTVAAAPGLSLDLNTDTRVSWKAGMPARVWLEQGEIAVRLAALHRLELLTPGGKFLLEPGAYNARLRGAGCELAILSGGGTFEGTTRRIGAGDVALANAGQMALRDAPDLGSIGAWQHDTLVLNGQSLDYALAEMNRYLPDKIVIGDPDLSRLRLGGTFSTTNPAEFLQALRTSFGVRATTGANGGIVLTRI